MKKFLALAALVLGLASCQTEPEGLDVNVGGAVDTVVTVNIPEAETRANDSGIGVFENGVLDGDATMRYIFQVYYDGKTNEASRQVIYSDDTTVSFPVRLVPGRDYQFVVWADVVTAENAGDNHYNTADLENITLSDPSTWVAMDETRDAFTATYEAKQYNGSQSINIDLYRPFAKLRVVTTDYTALANLGAGIKAAKATVKYTTDHRSAFNAYTSKAMAADKADVEHTKYVIAEYTDEDDASRTIFSDYFFAEEGDIVKFEMTVYDTNGQEIVTRVFNTDINVNRNYLTTIKGNILTDGNNVNVEVKPGFGDIEWPNTLAGELAKAAMFGGEITLTEDVVLEESLNVTSNMVINLNGHTITGPSEAKDANGNKIHTIVNNGDLTVNGGTIESVAENGGSAICNNAGANLTINNVEINGAPLVDGGWPSYGINNYGTMTINGAKVNTYHGGIATGGNGIAIIEDATVDVGLNTQTKQTSWALYVFDNGQMTVNGGTFKNTKNENGQVYGGGYICAISTSKTIINGGTFDKTEGDNNGTGFYYQCKNLEIKGGTFDVNPPATYLAEGYAAVDNGDGTWTVCKALNSSTISTVFENLSTTEPTTIAVTENINIAEPLAIPAGAEVTVNLGDKEITSATTDGFVVNEGATLTISGNGTVKSNGAPIRAIGGTVIVEGGTFTQTGAWNSTTSTYRYSVDSREGGEVIIKGGTFNTNNGLISVSANSSVVIDGGLFTFENNTGGTRHFAYVSGVLTINDGVFRGVADSGAGGCFFCGAASTCDIQVNGGKFTSLWTSGSVNKIFESYAGGSEITVTGGLFNSNGGITDFVEANTDAATSTEYPYVAKQ